MAVTKVGKALSPFQLGQVGDQLALERVNRAIVERKIDQGRPAAELVDYLEAMRRARAVLRGLYLALASEMKFTPRGDHCWIPGPVDAAGNNGPVTIGWYSADVAAAMMAERGCLRD